MRIRAARIAALACALACGCTRGGHPPEVAPSVAPFLGCYTLYSASGDTVRESRDSDLIMLVAQAHSGARRWGDSTVMQVRDSRGRVIDGEGFVFRYWYFAQDSLRIVLRIPTAGRWYAFATSSADSLSGTLRWWNHTEGATEEGAWGRRRPCATRNAP
jgi:hypothetical protein